MRNDSVIQISSKPDLVDSLTISQLIDPILESIINTQKNYASSVNLYIYVENNHHISILLSLTECSTQAMKFADDIKYNRFTRDELHSHHSPIRNFKECVDRFYKIYTNVMGKAAGRINSNCDSYKIDYNNIHTGLQKELTSSYEKFTLDYSTLADEASMKKMDEEIAEFLVKMNANSVASSDPSSLPGQLSYILTQQANKTAETLHKQYDMMIKTLQQNHLVQLHSLTEKEKKTAELKRKSEDDISILKEKLKQKRDSYSEKLRGLSGIFSNTGQLNIKIKACENAIQLLTQHEKNEKVLKDIKEVINQFKTSNPNSVLLKLLSSAITLSEQVKNERAQTSSHRVSGNCHTLYFQSDSPNKNPGENKRVFSPVLTETNPQL